MSLKNLVAGLACAFLISASPAVPFASAQTRVNDHDMEAMMRNLHADSQSFQSAFKDSIRKSTVRGTSEEKQDREMVGQFVKQTEQMLNQFKKTKQTGSALPATLDTAARIDKVVSSVQLDAKTTARWQKVRTELDQLAKAAGVENPLEGTMAPEDHSPARAARSAADSGLHGIPAGASFTLS